MSTNAAHKLKQSLRIAVVGATGNVGRTMLTILDERGFALSQVRAVASSRSQGLEVSFGEQGTLKVEDLTTFDFSKVDLALFSPGGAVSAIYAPKAIEQGCVVIDNTSHFRMNPDVPLVIPEVNGHILQETKSRLIANPNCSTIQLVMALKPLHDLAPITRVVCSTYQSVSGAGKEGMDELFTQTRGSFVNDAAEAIKFTKPIAFNVIPHIDQFLESGATKEEWKMAEETKKILDSSIALIATCVRVPVFIGHAVAATIEFASPLKLADARRALRNFPGVSLVDDPETSTYVTPIECQDEDTVFISRLRVDPTVAHGLCLWVVADNVRKGAALNAIQIAEALLKCGYFTTNRAKISN
ncbi:MAG: aspartate-semialdehyde dehydrogenase [Alphaproteobacteria bacterium]